MHNYPLPNIELTWIPQEIFLIFWNPSLHNVIKILIWNFVFCFLKFSNWESLWISETLSKITIPIILPRSHLYLQGVKNTRSFLNVTHSHFSQYYLLCLIDSWDRLMIQSPIGILLSKHFLTNVDIQNRIGARKGHYKHFFDDKGKDKIMEQESEFQEHKPYGSWNLIILLSSSNINLFD